MAGVLAYIVAGSGDGGVPDALREAGFTPLCAGTMEEAHRMLAEKAGALVMIGFDRRDCPALPGHQPVIVLAGHDGPQAGGLAGHGLVPGAADGVPANGLAAKAAAGKGMFADAVAVPIVFGRPWPVAAMVAMLQQALAAEARVAAAEREVAALRDSELRYRTLFDTMDEGFCIIAFLDGPEGPLSDYVHVEANAAYERHAGIPNVVGKRLRSIMPEEAETWLARYGEVLRTGKPVRFEQELVATRRQLALSAFRIEPPERRQVAVLFQDVTARNTAEARLRELNETLERRVQEALAERRLLADLVDGTDAFVEVMDLDFRWLAVNRAARSEFERLYGSRPRLGTSFLDLLADQPAQREPLRRLWSRALAGEEFTEVAELGDPRWGRRAYELKFNTLRDVSGRRIGAYHFATDVTGRLRDQQRLADATARMHEMAKLDTLGQLTGGVAHDFNNLLTPIMGTLELLQRRFGEDARADRLISGALQGAERAATLVQRLLTFARRQHLEMRAIDVGALVEGMRELIQRSLGPHIRVQVEVEPGLPPARIDPNQLELALLNLAVNARDAMGTEGQLGITVTRQSVGRAAAGLEAGQYVRLSVSDTGAGMDDETLKRAVEPFFTTKGVGKGTGLGLSMVHGLAAQSGGALRLASVPGNGTTAEIWLPCAAGAAENRAARPADAPGKSVCARILLVDDEDLVRTATAEMLRDMGHEVTEAQSAAAALGVLQSGTAVDLLVTDYLMPKMRGSALVLAARALRPDLPALLMTGYASLGDADAADLPRLAKPFREAELAQAVCRLLPREAPAAVE